jgi:hypothetical protein
MRGTNPPPNRLLPAVGLATLGIFTALFATSRAAYQHVISLWWARALPDPFIDSVTGAQVGCWQRGIDVYATDPCDPLSRLFDYSPLWLRLWFLPSDLKWTNALGLCQAVILIAMLAVLPRARTRKDSAVMLLALLSPACVWAVERSNVDLFMFVLAAAGILCLERGLPTRIAGYGAMLLGGLLKFYPAVLMLLLVRERTRICLTLGAAAAAILAGFVLGFRQELARALANTPFPSPFDYSFGAAQLPGGLGLIAGWPGLKLVLLPALLALCLLSAIRLARRPGFSAALDSLPQRETLCLLVGADLVCGCFFGTNNAGYRALYLLFVLPGLLALPGLFRSTAWAALGAMWIRIPLGITGPEHSVGWTQSGVAYLLFWLGREALWWWVVTVLLAVLVHMVLQSPCWHSLRGLSSARRHANLAGEAAGDHNAVR